MSRLTGTGARLTAIVLFAGLMAMYNANGREIGGADSQPTKFAARALALRGNLYLDTDIATAPALAERSAFARDREGHFRSAYSPVGSMVGGLTAIGLRALGADLDAPRGANLIAVLTASALTSAAVCLVFLTLARLASFASALAVSIGLALGTNFWVIQSQTLAQHDVVAFGFALTLFSWTRPTGSLQARHGWIGAIGLALAVTARTQMAPLVGVLGLGYLARVGFRRAAGPLLLVGAALGALLVAQWRWFGHPLGAMPALEALHPTVHAVSGSFSHEPWIGAAGLLVSPSRGILVFSPIVLIAIIGIRPALRVLPVHGLGWAFLGSLLLYAAYASYTVWWGGHTYGPRYMLDPIVWLTPPAAVALDRIVRAPWARLLAGLALAWSIAVAATGAFFADDWNTAPSEVDLHHERLWDWHDSQILRAWNTGLSPRNFNLFNWTSIRQAPPAAGPGGGS